jgi:4-amino-4-deoxy-L-arabinose transferase-like glycosyltransferase
MSTDDPSREGFSRNYVYGLGLGVVLLTAALVRGYRLTGRGLWYWDEGLFLQGARFLRWRFSGGELSGAGADAWLEFPGFPLMLWKPFHILLTALATLLFGDQPDALVIMAAVFGVLSVLAVVIVGRQLAGREAGLFAGLLLAVNSYHIAYSRCGLSEASGGFFVLAAVGFFLAWGQRLETAAPGRAGRLVLLAAAAGFCYGLAVATAYRNVVFAPLWVIWSAGNAVSLRYRPEGLRRVLVGLFVFGLGVVAVGGAMELCHRWAFAGPFAVYETPSYGLALQSKFSSESHFDLEHPFHFLGVLAEFEGLPWVVLAVLGAVLALAWRREALLVPALFAWWPLVMFSLSRERLTRAISPAIPFLCLGIGLLAALFWRGDGGRKRSLGRVLAVLLLACVVLGKTTAPGAFYLYRTSGYAEALTWVRAQQAGSARHFSTMWPITCALSSKPEAPRLPTTTEAARPWIQAGYRYLLVDWQQYTMPSAFTVEVKQTLLPVFAVRNWYARAAPVLGENHLPADVPRLPQRDPYLAWILIYDLSGLSAEPPTHSRDLDPGRDRQAKVPD